MTGKVAFSLRIVILCGALGVASSARAASSFVQIFIQSPSEIKEGAPLYERTQGLIQGLFPKGSLPSRPYEVEVNGAKRTYRYKVSGTPSRDNAVYPTYAALVQLWKGEGAVSIEGLDARDKVFHCQTVGCFPYLQITGKAAEALNRSGLNSLDFMSGDGRKAFDNGSSRGSVSAVAAGSYKGRAAGSLAQAGPNTLAIHQVPDPMSSDVDEMIRAAAKNHGVKNAVLRAWVQANSHFNADKKAAGAYGLMGLSKGAAGDAARRLGYAEGHYNLFDPKTNLNLGADHLARLMKEFNGDLDRVIVAYRLGRGYVTSNWEANRDSLINDPRVKKFRQDILDSLRTAPAAAAKSAPQEKPAAEAKATQDVQHPLHERIWIVLKQSVAQWWHIIRRKAEAYFHPQDHDTATALIAAVIKVESDGNPNATGYSHDAGLMQLIPGTAAQWNVRDAYDPDQNISGGTRYLRSLIDHYNGSLPWAIAAYNAGQGRADYWLRHDGRIMDPKVQTHVNKVMRYYYQVTNDRHFHLPSMFRPI